MTTTTMTPLPEIAPTFVEIAHRIVWATVASVDTSDRPRSRVLHPLWEWDGTTLTGWIATGPTPLKLAHLAHTPYLSVNYWDPQHDVATAECHATWHRDDETCARVWQAFVDAPAPVGYDPSMIPAWTDPSDAAFAVLRLDPWRLRVMPAAALLGEAQPLDWHPADRT